MGRAVRLPPTEWHLTSLYGKSDATRPDQAVARLAELQWGVVDVDELRALGLTDKAIMGRVRAGWLHPLYKRVYAVGHRNLTFQGEILAAVKACGPGALASHYSAAALAGSVKWDGRRPEVLVAGPTARRHPGIRVHRTTRLEPRDVTRIHGIPATTAARTLVDLAAILPEKQLRRAVREAQSRKLTSLPQIAATLRRLAPCRGSARLARIVSTGPAPTRSELEDAVLDLLLEAGVAHPDVNVALAVEGRRVIPDFRWPKQRLVLEADGAAWHDHRLAREDDAERQALLEAHGERVVRITWRQAVRDPARSLARIRAAGAPPG